MAWSASPAGARDEALLVGLYVTVLLLPVLVLPRTAGAGERPRLRGSGPCRPWRRHRTRPRHLPKSDVAPFRRAPRLPGLVRQRLLRTLRSRLLARGRDRRTARLTFVGARYGDRSRKPLPGARNRGPEQRHGARPRRLAVLVFALAPSRLRLLGATLLAAVPAGAAVVPLTAPYRSSAASVAHRAGWTAVAVLIIGAALGIAYSLADRRLELGAARRRSIGRGVLALLIAGIAAAVIAFFVSVPAPGAWVSKEWTSFKAQAVGSDGIDTPDGARIQPLRLLARRVG